ncbi:hypothetical protein GCM10010289_05830 [Streptomyces violascens]|uniref:Uncharacterized protein n=1 Tax=Streptomyces violascens TaxID=67381 RepID=A0ABQ3QGA4_9ACTN|nr:hypothetical protein GCM10010289_05830 [Streptomyces violascens]GHI36249.1 hypothetical protein Sviol_06570 [Streptomyces violascens]
MPTGYAPVGAGSDIRAGADGPGGAAGAAPAEEAHVRHAATASAAVDRNTRREDEVVMDQG